jgi:hypothetical protein
VSQAVLSLLLMSLLHCSMPWPLHQAQYSRKVQLLRVPQVSEELLRASRQEAGPPLYVATPSGRTMAL